MEPTLISEEYPFLVLQPVKSALCVVGLGFESHWISILKDGQEETWLKSPRPKNIEVMHVHGRPLSSFEKRIDLIHETLRWRSRRARYFLAGLDLILFWPIRTWVPRLERSSRLNLRDSVMEARMPDYFPLARSKELSYFKYFLTKSTADFLITTTNSSYLNLNLVSEKLQALDATKLYFGPFPYQGANFVSGSFRIFSRDVVDLIVANRSRWDVWDLEDVAIGKLLAKLGIKPTFIDVNNMDTVEKVLSTELQHLKSQMHFRLKSGTTEKRQDVPLMLLLHSRIENEK